MLPGELEIFNYLNIAIQSSVKATVTERKILCWVALLATVQPDPQKSEKALAPDYLIQ